MESERGMARTALHEYRAAGSEAVERESQRARARVAGVQERVRQLAQEVHVSELLGEGRLRLVEQTAQAQLDDQQRQLRELGVVHGQERDHVAAEMDYEWVQAQGQQQRQHTIAEHAQAEIGFAQRDFEVMQRASQESQQHIPYLRSEMQEQAAQVDQLTTMLQQVMQQNDASAGDGAAAMQADTGGDPSF